MIFDKYPYTNFHEMNDDWVIQTLRMFDQKLDEFVAANSLTYADPIEYDPATIYPANTVVIYNETAYVSKQAVPAGMLPAADSDYWLLIFPFGELIRELISAGIEDAAPALVNDWMLAHPAVTTTVNTNSITYQKLHTSLQDILLNGYDAVDENAETIPNSAFEQGNISYVTGEEIPATASCRTGFVTFGDYVVKFAALTGYFVTIYDYDNDGNYLNRHYTASGAISGAQVSAFLAAADHKYRVTIGILDGTLAPADIPFGAIMYIQYLPAYMRNQDEVLASVTATGNTSGTNNVNLNTTIPQDTLCTVEITASAPNTSRNITLVWRNSTGNLNSIGSIPAGNTHAIFENVAPNADAGLIRINNTVANATYNIRVTTTHQVNVLDELVSDFNGIGDKTPIADVLTFSNGYWQNATTFSTNVQYRVGAAAYTFDKDVVISAYNGYYIGAYVDGVSYGTSSQVAIPKGKIAKIYIRKIWEDTSTPVTVAEMTNNVFILNLNKLTEYERLTDTFAGLEMFRTVGFIGDSYTATRLGMSWVDIVQNRTGVSCTKYAKSGDDSGAWLTDSANGLPALNADTAKDAYWIALGINDGDRVDANAAYLGTISDINGSYESYPDTFYGNYGHVIEAVLAHAPNAKIVLYKPVYRSQARTLQGVSATQNGLKLVRDAIDVIAEHYGLPVMDALDDVLYRSVWYTSHMDSAVSAGTHPAVMLYTAIAAANMRLFSKAVQKYDTYFMNISYSNAGGGGHVGEPFIVTLTPTALDYSGTMDKTVAEIDAAYKAGQQVVFRVITGENSSSDIPASSVDSVGYTYVGFTARVVEFSNDVLVCMRIYPTDDGTDTTYATIIYSLERA